MKLNITSIIEKYKIKKTCMIWIFGEYSRCYAPHISVLEFTNLLLKIKCYVSNRTRKTILNEFQFRLLIS